MSVNVPMFPGVARLFTLADASATGLMKRSFTTATLDRLASGTDETGRRLPASAHVAAARLGLIPVYPKGLYVPSRVDRMIQANVVSTLRTLAERDTALQQLTSTGSLAASHPKVRAGVAKNLGRQVARHLKDHPDADIASLRLPFLQDAPVPGSRLVLGAVDKQLATLELTPSGTFLVLTLRLPTRVRPTGRGHWVATEIILPIPKHLQDRPITKWHLPTITPHPTKPGIARFHLAYTEPDAPGRDPKTPITSVVGIDWSPSALGVVSRVTAGPDGELSSAFEGHRYEDRGLGIKLFRLQQEGEILSGKIARTGHLSDGLPEDSPVRARLEAKIAIWKQLRSDLGAKRARINRELAFHFANWATGYAQTTGATTIAIEDLSTLGAGGIGRANNNRVAQSARRKAVHATTHLAARAGLEVIEVPARGTSAHCPGCDAELTRPGGYHRARCRACGLEGNRDQIAAVNIAKRAITGQDSLRTDRKTGRKRIKKAAHAPVKRVRRPKNAPTPRLTRHKRVRHSVAPKVVKVAKTIFPAPPASVWDADQPPGTRAPRPPTPDAPVSGSDREP
ncbi:zinc ribbon domain-containing protein [Paeniglutamicibacter gangotriensis]|uniref:zinc ribbon domain-containing protein n=1 Tax=Paeniglutamicibacter gangotriensis TaxID=254787 RepID=UPI0037C95AB6